MKKIELGNTCELISCMGLGTMYFGTRIDQPTSYAILDHYFEKGGCFLDSANKYASWEPGFKGGESEYVIGKWIKKRHNRNALFITSKVGFAYGNIPRSLRKEIIISECERSLKRMGIDVIDLYFAHTFDVDTPVEESMEAFYLLKKHGKIRFVGASNHYAWQVAEANMFANARGWEGFCCIQQRHSYLEPSLRANFGTQLLLTPEIQYFCQIKNLSLMSYSPLLGGAYVRNDRRFPVHYQSATNEFRLNQLNHLSNVLNVSANAVVLAWMLLNAPPLIPIVAGSTVSQIEDSLTALEISLSAEHLELLNKDVVQPNKYS